MLIQFIKTFFTKADFDYDSPNIDLFKFHPQIRILLASIGIFFNNKDSYFRLIWPALSIMFISIASVIQLLFTYHGYVTKNYSFTTYCFCNFLILFTVPASYTSVLFNNRKIINLLNQLNVDFIYVCNLGPKYKDPFLRGQLLIWQSCFSWLGLAYTVSSLFVIATLSTLLYQSLFEIQDVYAQKPLVYPMWIAEDYSYWKPNYVSLLMLQITTCAIVPQVFGVTLYLIFHVLLHNYYIMDMIILDFEVIFDGLDETAAALDRHDPRRVQVRTSLNNRMRRIVQWHVSVFRSLEAVSSIFATTLLFQILCSSLMICFMLYQVAESIDRGKLDILFVLLNISACVQLWITCYLGTLIQNKAFSVGDACWNCGWQNTALGRMLCQDILIVVIRAQQPVSIKFAGLPSLALETFSSVMSTSYSYFNLLRQQ